MEPWQEKLERAKNLVERIKTDKESVDTAEDALKLRAMFDESLRLADEAKGERRDLEKARLDEVMSEHERQQELGQKVQQASESFKVTRPQSIPFAPSGQAGGRSLSERMRSDSPRMMASERLVQTMPILYQAALNEGTAGSGGYLVVPAYLQELFAETRRQGNALRGYGWLNVHPVETNQVLIPKGSGAASVGIVSENTAKPSADQTYTQVTVNIFTAAGISKQSKQLAMDSSPTVLDLSTRELGTLLGNLEEQKALNGSGTGEPRGILNVTGIGSQTVTGGAGTQNAVLDALMDAVVFIETNYFAPPSGILMHPRRLAWLLKGKDSALNYIFNPAATFRQPNMAPLVNNNVTSMSTGYNQPPASLFGIPIATTANMPTNLGAGTNEDRVIVGAFNEAHWFQRQDVTMDVSDSAGTSWEQNQVWIRAEERFGFSAERYPVAFSVLSGTCLLQT